MTSIMVLFLISWVLASVFNNQWVISYPNTLLAMSWFCYPGRLSWFLMAWL